MPFTTFRTKESQPRVLVGKVLDEHVMPLAGPASFSMKSLFDLTKGDLDQCGDYTKERFALGDVELLPPVVSPGKIFCIGLNYHAHRIETGNEERAYPTVFSRFATCLVGHDSPVWRPSVSNKMDFEGELAVVIGREGYRVQSSDAMDIVAGYSCFNDISIRDWQRHTSQFTPGKNFLRTGAFGPVLMTKNEVPDPASLTLTTLLNGEEMQRTTTDLMIFDIPELIAYITTFTRLEPGDVIVTGTPGGVGVKRDPQVFMQPGDVVEVDITGVGRLVNHVVDEPRPDQQVNQPL